MGSKKYTLEPLIDVRTSAADAAKRELGEAIRTRETRDAELQAARSRTLAHADSIATTQRAERAALEQGELRAVDLLRQDAWKMQQDRTAEDLAHDESRSAAAVVAATATETDARTETGTRLGELEAVLRDRARFTEREQRALLAKEEEAAEEAWRPRR